MEFLEVYLEKQSFRPEIKEEPNPLLNICVVIPCYNEPDLLRSLQSIWECARAVMAVEVLIVVNSPENCISDILDRNLATLNDGQIWINDHFDPKLRFHLIYKPNLPRKFAGVGLARKIGMDEAAYRLSRVNNYKGIMTGFDADSVCDSNYLVEIEKHFDHYKQSHGASVYFEHPVSGAAFESLYYSGIISYELHLRYLNQGLRFTKHPFAFHTVGSSFTVRMDAYVKQGGMNRKQAGEDFYFIQKIIELGNFTEINTTRVIPSPRESDRVPFGTGAAMKNWITDGYLKTYSFTAFEDLFEFTTHVNQLYQANQETVSSILESLSLSLNEFLCLHSFQTELKSIVSNSASLPTFRSRFFRWFNAFKVIKYLNFSHHEKQYEKTDIMNEAERLLNKLGFKMDSKDPLDLLNFYRELDRSGFGFTQQ